MEERIENATRVCENFLNQELKFLGSNHYVKLVDSAKHKSSKTEINTLNESA
jgi:hypothetical protein